MSETSDIIANSPVAKDGKNEADVEAIAFEELLGWKNKVSLALSAASHTKSALESELLEVHKLKAMIGSGIDVDTLRVFAENERVAHDKISEFAGLKAGITRAYASFSALEAENEKTSTRS